ncbi:hypothetical protein R50073_09120 [Maricurvus nonylphenolicus]|uniref:glycine-rich domain-containing protein n=1 Tax=Maricurvus nonylphenolicus TaxID=1008307 RepID=UPI0036F3BE55
MPYIIAAIIAALFAWAIYRSYRRSQIAKREVLIDTYQFPTTIKNKVAEKYPHLNEKDTEMVMRGLREYFHLCNIAGKRMVSMPSQAVDVAWHEFILFTRKYEFFCDKALGRFLHHTPAEAMESPTVAQAGIKTAWKISCFREDIEPKAATKLPLLFAMDAKLDIPDGFKYSLNCQKAGSNNYCAGHIGCGSGCGGGCGGDSSGCGGGCGGD